MRNKFYKKLSKKYHSEGSKQLTEKEVESYLIARMPATLAVNLKVLTEVAHRVTHSVHTFLDLGAGPGTGLLAVKEIFTLQSAVLVEKNPYMVAKGKELVEAKWLEKDFFDVNLPPSDLVLLSYSLGELTSKKEIEVLKKAWSAAKTLVVIEPGTPRGFEVILQARKELIERGGNMIAPCPHTKKCPMEKGDWCHFSVRLERSKEHKQAKEATLGWEDEKFSYVAFSKEPTFLAEGRIVRPPQKRKGHVALHICGQNELEERLFSRKQEEEYKKARKAKWGDPI